MQRKWSKSFFGFVLVIALTFGAYFVLNGRNGKTGAESELAGATSSVFEGFAIQSRDAAFERLSGPWTLSLPEDHGGHDEARAETWTFLVHMTTDEGEPIGLELTMARLGLVPAGGRDDGVSAKLSSIYRAHVIVTDTVSGKVQAEERLSRGIGAAGHDLEAQDVWLDDWQFAYGTSGGRLTLALNLRADNVPISLRLIPQKPAEKVTQDQGMRGFAIPRLAAEGAIGERAVRGTAVLTHLWGDVPLPGGATANDVLSIQLDDGSDLSLVRTTRRDGRGPATLDGVISDANAEFVALSDDRYDMVPITGDGQLEDVNWADTSWFISGPDLDLEAVPLLMDHHKNFAFSLSSGLVHVSGTRGGRPVEGIGTLQRSGHEQQP